MESLSASRTVHAMSVGPQEPLILRGRMEAASWSPGGIKERDPRLAQILTDLYAGDPLLAPALASGLQTEAMAAIATAPDPNAMAAQPAAMQPAAMQQPAGAAQSSPQQLQAYAAQQQQQAANQARKLGDTLAKFMLEPNGPQIAAVSLDGFDTHANQGAADGQLATRLRGLDAAIDGLSSGLGPEWKNTVVVVATEFGRTARMNGTQGHRPRHRLDGARAGRGAEEGRHHRRLADAAAGQAVREPRHRAHARHARPVQGGARRSTRRRPPRPRHDGVPGQHRRPAGCRDRGLARRERLRIGGGFVEAEAFESGAHLRAQRRLYGDPAAARMRQLQPARVQL